MAKKQLLLHTCCAPCSIHIAEMLKNEYDLTLFFHNPQIFPATEYAKRLVETRKVGDILGVPVIEGARDYEGWLSAVEGLEDEPEGGKRCMNCFMFNLEGTAKFAKSRGFDSFATTLTVSPHKNAPAINRIGLSLAKKHGINFIDADFKKNDGFLKSSIKCREHGIYRQDYCGCKFSLKSSMASPNE